MNDRNGGGRDRNGQGPNGGSGEDARLQRELAGLKAEHQRLRDEKLRAEQDAANLTRQMDELKARAEAEYGTSDPAELAALLERRRAENAAMVAEYREHLAAVGSALAEVERGFGGGEGGGAGSGTGNGLGGRS
jgi:chromosome segregation ATPase